MVLCTGTRYRSLQSDFGDLILPCSCPLSSPLPHVPIATLPAEIAFALRDPPLAATVVIARLREFFFSFLFVMLFAKELTLRQLFLKLPGIIPHSLRDHEELLFALDMIELKVLGGSAPDAFTA